MKPIRIAVGLLLAIGVGSLGGCGGSLGDVRIDLASVAPTGDDILRTTKTSGASWSKKLKVAQKAKNTKSDSAYYIGALDVLDISVFKVNELSKSVQVADMGTINYPLIGEVQAKGKTAQQLERLIAAKLSAKYLENPQVTVFVKEYNSRRVTVNGSVKKAGVFPIRGRTTLVSIIAEAGGLDKDADSTIIVIRESDSKRKAARFNIDAIKSGELDDPVIRAGDVVIVGRSAIKAVFQNFLKVIPIVGTFAAL